MSDENVSPETKAEVQTPEDKITSSEQPRPKDPRRVEAGRRLGAISKAAKEKKARERFTRELEVENEAKAWSVNDPRLYPVVGVFLAACLGYVLLGRDRTPSDRDALRPASDSVYNKGNRVNGDNVDGDGDNVDLQPLSRKRRDLSTQPPRSKMLDSFDD